MVVAAAPYLEAESSSVDRLVVLAEPAIAESVAVLSHVGGEALQAEAYVGLPLPRPGRPHDLTPVADAVQQQIARAGLKVRHALMIETGHAAGTMAITEAAAAISAGRVDVALAGGVDTYLDPETLEWLESNDQLHSAGLENNAYGFIPGEAATFVLLTSYETAHRFKLEFDVELLGSATAHEHKIIKTDMACTGEGLTVLFRSLAESLGGVQADDLYCDMNGEPYRAEEFGFASVRAGGWLKDPSDFHAPADCWGDIGAASGPGFLILAEAAARKGYAAGPVAVAFTSSESGERSGFISRSTRYSEVQ